MSEKKCDHIIAFHIGHSEIKQSDDKEVLEDTCCGGVMRLKFCPLCGGKNENNN